MFPDEPIQNLKLYLFTVSDCRASNFCLEKKAFLWSKKSRPQETFYFWLEPLDVSRWFERVARDLKDHCLTFPSARRKSREKAASKIWPKVGPLETFHFHAWPFDVFRWFDRGARALQSLVLRCSITSRNPEIKVILWAVGGSWYIPAALEGS